MGQNKELAIALAEYAKQVQKLHEALKEVREYVFNDDDEESFADGYDEGCGHDLEEEGGAYDQAMREEYGDDD